MSQNVNGYNLDLGEIRRRAWRAWAQDGLLEITLASWCVYFFITTFVSMLDDLNADWLQITLIFPLMMMVGMPYLKKRFTYPRIGEVTMVSEEARTLVIGILTFTMILGVVVFVLDSTGQDMSLLDTIFENLVLILGVFAGGLFSFMAYRYGLTRFYVYGLASLIAGIVAPMLHDRMGAQMMVYCGVMTAILLPAGLVLFVRFLRNNPVLDEEGAFDGQG